MDKIKYRNQIPICIISLLLLAQRFIFGVTYYPAVDDWFLYLGRNMVTPDLATRPFAGLFDHYIIAPLSDHLVIIELLLIAMLVASAYLLWHGLFPKSKTTDTVFLLMIALFPVSFEGLYWIAAAARIVPSLFFIGLGVCGLRQYLENNKLTNLVIYILSSIFTTGFYEAFIPVYLILTTIVTVSAKKKHWLMAIPILFSGLMALYYVTNSQDVTISGRLELVKLKDLPSHIIYVYEHYKDLLKHSIELITGSFVDGLRGVKEYPIGGTLVLMLSVALGVFAQPVNVQNKLKWLLVAIALIIGGIALNFVICFVRVPFRLFGLMIPGIALAVQIAFSLIPRIPYKILTGIMAFTFAICNIGSLTLYKYTNDRDTQLAKALIEDYNAGSPDRFTYVINAPSYWYDDRVQAYEYVKASTENYATLMGQVQYMSQKRDLNFIMCLHEQNSIGAFAPEEVDALYLYWNGAELEECSLIFARPGFDVVTRDGTIVGHITVANNLFTYKNIPQE